MAKSKKKSKKTKAKKPKKIVKPGKPRPSIYRKTELEPPEGFELLEAAEDNITEARDKIQRLLKKVCDSIPVACYFSTHAYKKAGEVDGELTVSGVRGTDTSSIISMIQEVMLPDVPPSSDDYKTSVLGKGYWVTIGFRWQGTADEEDEDRYKKWHGMFEVSSNYRSMTLRSKVLSAFSVGQLPSSRNPNSMVANIEDKFRRKIAQIFVRVVWNSKNIQPLRSPTKSE